MKRYLGAIALSASFLAPAYATSLVIGMDFPAVPTNTTGKDGHGGYDTIYITNPPAFSDWGVGSHIYIGGVEVAAYCSQATPPWDNGTIPKQPAITGVRFQVGSLGGAAYGTALPVDVVVGGAHATNNRYDGTYYYSMIVGADAPNKRTGYVGDYEPLQFTPINGQVLYVDPSAGSDSNAGDWLHPLQHLQGADGYSGALKNSHSGTYGVTQPDGTKPATQIVLRGGNHTPVGDWHPASLTGNGGRWANLIRVSGVNPGSGQWQGPISVTSYPGDAGSNANEVAVMDQTSYANGAGGIIGPDTTRANEQNLWDGSTGWGHQVGLSWVKVIANPWGPNDGAPYNLNNGMHDARLVAVDGSWDSQQTGALGGRCGGWCGNGFRVRTFLNNFHGIHANDGMNQNHGIYPDSSVTAAQDVTIAFTAITDVNQGSSISINHSGSDTDHIQNLFIYGNWMYGAHKANLNVYYAQSVYAWNNVMAKAGEAAVNIANGMDFITNGFQVFNNDILDWDQLGGGRAAFWDQGGDGATWDARNNLCMRRVGGTGTGPWYIVNFPTYLFTKNIWWDATGGVSQAIPDGSAGLNSNPKFTNAATDNFTLGTTSPALDFAASLLGSVPREFDFMLKPVAGSSWDGGAYEKQ